MPIPEAQEVLNYWFGGPERDPSKRAKWFGGGEAGDREVKDKFGDLVEKARNDELKHWEEDADATLALIILQDQFCRSIYRGTSKAFDRDPYCVKLAEKFLEKKTHDHEKYQPTERFFMYLPFEHAEDKDLQARSVHLFEKLLEDAKSTPDAKSAEFWFDFASKHKFVVDKFGRFPARNKAIGRENTPEEQEFLDNPPPGYKW
ncbi:uncharacterized protein LOC5506826 [Nematostella vectensis]|uniref:uncharacterized protein LOC5506826 n=1 Tax=Nematostella vectensis TaxID=45351 RepID=UPI00139064C0|nr:uncharacterized protein LOC5506826 [Nematostella vectensis]